MAVCSVCDQQQIRELIGNDFMMMMMVMMCKLSCKMGDEQFVKSTNSKKKRVSKAQQQHRCNGNLQNLGIQVLMIVVEVHCLG
jgi:hypothetical protein